MGTDLNPINVLQWKVTYFINKVIKKKGYAAESNLFFLTKTEKIRAVC